MNQVLAQLLLKFRLGSPRALSFVALALTILMTAISEGTSLGLWTDTPLLAKVVAAAAWIYGILASAPLTRHMPEPERSRIITEAKEYTDQQKL